MGGWTPSRTAGDDRAEPTAHDPDQRGSRYRTDNSRWLARRRRRALGRHERQRRYDDGRAAAGGPDPGRVTHDNHDAGSSADASTAVGQLAARVGLRPGNPAINPSDDILSTGELLPERYAAPDANDAAPVANHAAPVGDLSVAERQPRPDHTAL
jgi:hypothetical protein